MSRRSGAGKGGKGGSKGHNDNTGLVEAESLDDIAGIADTKARYDRVLDVSAAANEAKGRIQGGLNRCRAGSWLLYLTP